MQPHVTLENPLTKKSECLKKKDYLQRKNCIQIRLFQATWDTTKQWSNTSTSSDGTDDETIFPYARLLTVHVPFSENITIEYTAAASTTANLRGSYGNLRNGME